MARQKKTVNPAQTAEYRHKEETPARPDVGTQPQFKKKAPPKNFRYDSSLSPALDWDGQNAAREQGDLLKNMRSSQIFSVCGLPEVALRKAKAPAHEITKDKKAATWFEVELLGLDVFDPATMEVAHRKGNDVPAWLLDTDYNGLSFHVSQAFFPRTAAWDSLKRALKADYEDAVWQHLAGGVSVPFEAGEHAQIAVKVIDDRGNELMVVRSLKEAQ